MAKAVVAQRADRFEFTETLDMSPFVSEPSPDGEEYVLHSVLVHSGASLCACFACSVA
jgi:hypothetical protein